jgi:hypothetical protein
VIPLILILFVINRFLFPHAVVRLARDSDCSVQCAVMDHFIDFVGVIGSSVSSVNFYVSLLIIFFLPQLLLLAPVMRGMN